MDSGLRLSLLIQIWIYSEPYYVAGSGSASRGSRSGYDLFDVKICIILHIYTEKLSNSIF